MKKAKFLWILLLAGLLVMMGCPNPTTDDEDDADDTDDGGTTTVAVTGVTVDATATVEVGSTVTLTATVAPADATDSTVAWTSAAEGTATVSAAGVVTGVAAGDVVITVTTTDGAETDTCTVTVTEPVVLPLQVAGVGDNSSLADTVKVNWGAWAAGAPDGDANGDGWDESLTKYEVSYSTSSLTDPATGTLADVAVSADGIPGFPVTVVSGATAETDYYVYVRAVNANGNGDWSAEAVITTPAAVLANVPPTTIPAGNEFDDLDANVLYLFDVTGTYSSAISVSNWNPGWGQSGSLGDYDTGAGIVKYLDMNDYQGMEFTSTDLGAASHYYLHIVYYTTNTSVMDITLIDGDAEAPVTTSTATLGAWTEEVLDYTTVITTDSSAAYQIKFAVNGGNGNECDFYIGAMYFSTTP